MHDRPARRCAHLRSHHIHARILAVRVQRFRRCARTVQCHAREVRAAHRAWHVARYHVRAHVHTRRRLAAETTAQVRPRYEARAHKRHRCAALRRAERRGKRRHVATCRLLVRVQSLRRREVARVHRQLHGHGALDVSRTHAARLALEHKRRLHRPERAETTAQLLRRLQTQRVHAHLRAALVDTLSISIMEILNGIDFRVNEDGEVKTRCTEISTI